MSRLPSIDCAVVLESGGNPASAQQLAEQLGTPLNLPAPTTRYQVIFSAAGVALHDTEFANSRIQVDFTSTKFNYLRRTVSTRNHLLARAVGAKHQPRVIDATAGLGRDSFILACLGCQVIALERSPVMAALLADGLVRWQAVEPELAQCIHLHHGDSIELLANLPTDWPPAQAVLLDPMYPARKKSALNQQAMRSLHGLVGEDNDTPALLAVALASGIGKVVLKRPLRADVLASDKLSHQYKGRSGRWDVYQHK